MLHDGMDRDFFCGDSVRGAGPSADLHKTMTLPSWPMKKKQRKIIVLNTLHLFPVTVAMKFTFLLSVAALMAMTAAQSADVAAEPSLDVNYADPAVDDSISTPINFDYNDVIDQPPNEMPDNENLDNDFDNHVDDRDKKSQFTAWSSPGYKGHKQRRKNTKGCYRLDGGAVGSFEGSTKVQYGFYKDDRCRGEFLFGSSSAPVKTISPIIYPRSVKMFETDGTPVRPDPSRFALVAWSRPKFYGDKQLIRGMGCQDMDGSDVYSFQGNSKYKFYADRYCHGRKVLETNGGKSSISKINPRSVYIYK